METGERSLPEDIRKLAYELAYEGSMPPLAASAERIAAALLAERMKERKRCALLDAGYSPSEAEAIAYA